MIDTDSRLDHPIGDCVQQGAIFNCVVLPQYEKYACSGIVINARCDLEHAKVDAVTYLPIIPFRAWIERMLCRDLAWHLRQQSRSLLEDFFRRKAVSSQISQTFPARDIVERNAKSQKERQQMLDACGLLELAETVLAGEAATTLLSELFEKGKKHRGTAIRDLVNQKSPGVYFLAQTDVDSPAEEGAVVLLRQVRTLPYSTMKMVVKGLEIGPPLPCDFANHFTADHAPICMVTGVLRSPDIEHLTQAFAAQFTRIGLADPLPETVSRHERISEEF